MENFRSYGNPPRRVAVIHGGPGAAGEMAPVARQLAPEFGVIEPLQAADSIDGQIEELTAILKSAGALPLTLIGFSWGAWLSLLFAARHPEIAAKVILVGCPPLEERYAAGIMKTRMERLGDDEREEVGRTRASLDDPSFTGDKDGLMCRLGEILSGADAFDLLPAINEAIDCRWDIFKTIWPEAAALRRNGMLLDRIKNVKCPVVAIHGDYDPHPAAGVQAPLENIVDNFRFILLERCGHEPWRERQAGDEFFRVLRMEMSPTSG